MSRAASSSPVTISREVLLVALRDDRLIECSVLSIMIDSGPIPIPSEKLRVVIIVIHIDVHGEVTVLLPTFPLS